ncbi:hypothetical protein TRIUR3_08607 [Triticum urartu]|uniref:TLC domain-containing protein n=2 Tax=Triticum TaxID=4564 RepID=A0A9R0ZL67_TRITD|nr:hypothetical protein TRIUR3_08607 [Triticum urartu]VAI79799.1 unnamed protein product [Triticum turgidum subsp. durum]
MGMEYDASSTTGSMFLPFLAMFGAIYLLGYFVVFRRWSLQQRPDASSCLTSLFHGTPATLLALRAVLSSSRAGDLAAPNMPADDLALDFSTAYFTVDLIHYLVFLPHEVLFVAHHLATLYVFATCRAAEICHPLKRKLSCCKRNDRNLPSCTEYSCAFDQDLTVPRAFTRIAKKMDVYGYWCT